jgi:hypothetical protein
MTKTKIIAVLGFVLLVAVFFVVRYSSEFSRIKRVDVGSTPLQPDSIGKVVFSNRDGSKVNFVLRCFHKVRAEGKPLFSEVVSLPPNGSVEFDVNPELADRELPRMVANKSCEAVWRGPFGIERSAWWVNWQYGRPAYKTRFE